jgi:hypothetical protein
MIEIMVRISIPDGSGRAMNKAMALVEKLGGETVSVRGKSERASAGRTTKREAEANISAAEKARRATRAWFPAEPEPERKRVEAEESKNLLNSKEAMKLLGVRTTSTLGKHVKSVSGGGLGRPLFFNRADVLAAKPRLSGSAGRVQKR